MIPKACSTYERTLDLRRLVSRSPSVSGRFRVSALVGEVARMLGMIANDVSLPSIRRVTVHTSLLAVKQSAQHRAVVHVCSGRYYAVNRSRPAIQADVRFHPEVPLIEPAPENWTER